MSAASAIGSSSSKVASEDELGQKWDRCIADTILKTGTGVGLGLVFSLLIFKRRPWPVALGTGFGLGYAMSNCQHDFRRVSSVYQKPIIEKTTVSEVQSNVKLSTTDKQAVTTEKLPDSTEKKS